MILKRWTKMARNILTNQISVRGGGFTLGHALVKHFPDGYAEIYYDDEKHIIALKPTNNLCRNAYKLVGQASRTNASTVATKAIIKKLNVKTGYYTPNFDAESGMLLFEYALDEVK